MPYVKVSLVADQVAVLIGVTDTYASKYIQLLEQRVKLANSVDEVKSTVKTALDFTRAKLDLDKALYVMLEEGEAREAYDIRDPYEVLFLPSEHQFLTNIMSNNKLDRSSPAAIGHSEETIAKAEALVSGTAEALRAGVEVTAEQVSALRLERAKYAPKSDAELTKGFFVQTKAGLA